MRRIVSIIVLLILVTGGGLAWGYARYTGPGPLAQAKTVIVLQGAGVAGIARQLTDAGVISNPLVFRLGARVMGVDRDLRAGEYAIPAGASARDVVTLLHQGRTVLRQLTVVEGMTTARILEMLAAKDGLRGRAEADLEEGSLLPETYYFSHGDSRQEMLLRMADAMRDTLLELWDGRASGLPLKTPREALILASMVEKETGRSEERARIAAVFLNRLERSMRLQSDPTVVYGLTAGREMLGRPLTRADLKNPSPYNTYLIRGLPPTPICNPGKAAIAAVLRPAVTDELYFVADGAGGHFFARTLAEHNRNVARWRAVEKKREGTSD